MSTAQPTPILALCDAATKEEGKLRAYFIHESQATLYERLSPEVVRAVYEALVEARDGQQALLVTHGLVGDEETDRLDKLFTDALALLDGHNLNTEKKS